MTRDVIERRVETYIELYRVYQSGQVVVTYRLNGTSPYLTAARGDLLKSNGFIETPYSAYRYVDHHHYFDVLDPTVRNARVWTGSSWQDNFYREGQRGVRDGNVTLGLSDPMLNNTLSAFEPGISGKSVNKAISRISSADVNVGTFLGEAPESAKMIASTAIKVLQGYRAARRGEFSKIPKILGIKSVKDYTKTPAGAWFAYKFGWKPLVEDVYNMASAVNKQLQKPKYQAVRGSAEGNYTSVYTDTSYVRRCTVKRQVVTRVKYTIENEWLHNAQALGLLNPVSIAWELVPMSFVVDWFVPIGDMINGFSATAGLQFGNGGTTSVCIREYTQEPKPGTIVKSSRRTFNFWRVPMTTFPFPACFVEASVSRNQALTLLGLISQRT